MKESSDPSHAKIARALSDALDAGDVGPARSLALALRALLKRGLRPSGYTADEVQRMIAAATEPSTGDTER